MIQNTQVFDFHCHFPVDSPWFPDYNMPGKVSFDDTGSRDHHTQWRKAFNFSEPDPPMNDRESADRYIRDMDEKGIERINFVSGGGNRRLADIVAMYPERFTGFAHHHPEVPDAADQLETALRDYRLKGYKLLGPLIDTPLSDRSFYPLWEICETYQVPVLIHFGLLGAAGGTPHGTNISPMSIAQASRDFPKLNFIVPHFGCTHMQDLLQVCWTRPNVYVDTSGSNQWIRWMPYPLTLEDVIQKYVQTVGPGRIIFATDSSYFPRGFAKIYLEEQHKLFRFAGLDDNEIDMVFNRNARHLLGEL